MTPTKINEKRLLDDLAALGSIGAGPDGGVTRLAYSQEEQDARAWFIARAQEAGLATTVDGAGNVLALEPDAGDALPILSGSHLDTVPGGGRFDGMLGVVAALEAVRAISQQGPRGKRRPLGALALAAEESSRFGVACLGSQMLTGTLAPDALDTLSDPSGITLRQAMQQRGLCPEPLSGIKRRSGWFAEFVELHIDQSDDLARAGVPLGVITGIAAPTRLRVDVRGRQAHSGSTPMDARQDALAGAAELVLAVERAAFARRQQEIVGTVGVFSISPGAMNVIPGRAELGVDVRGIDHALVQAVIAEIEETARTIAHKRGLKMDISLISQSRPLRIAPERVQALMAVCRDLGVPAIPMISRAGHDAMYLGRLGPVSMIFVRNPAGVSHNPAELATEEDIIIATRTLAAYLALRATE